MYNRPLPGSRKWKSWPKGDCMRIFSIAAALLLSLAGAQPVFSQAGASAGIYGSVLDAQGAIIPGVRVTLQHVRTNQVRTAVTNQPGEYSFPLLPVGEYRISVEHPGFKKYEETGILYHRGQGGSLGGHRRNLQCHHQDHGRRATRGRSP